MDIKFYILNASGKLEQYKSKLKSAAKIAVGLTKKLLPIKKIDIVFFINPEGTINEIGGIGGFTPNANSVFISLNPKHPNFKKSLDSDLIFLIVHELSHTIRWQKKVEGDTLLEAIIFEGLADHFAMEVTGRKRPLLWSTALDEKEKKKFLIKASKTWEAPIYNHPSWFFGATPRIIPRWTGYALGYFLVEKYLHTHNNTSASQLMTADPSLFI